MRRYEHRDARKRKPIFNRPTIQKSPCTFFVVSFLRQCRDTITDRSASNKRGIWEDTLVSGVAHLAVRYCNKLTTKSTLSKNPVHVHIAASILKTVGHRTASDNLIRISGTIFPPNDC